MISTVPCCYICRYSDDKILEIIIKNIFIIIKILVHMSKIHFHSLITQPNQSGSSPCIASIFSPNFKFLSYSTEMLELFDTLKSVLISLLSFSKVVEIPSSIFFKDSHLTEDRPGKFQAKRR